MPNTFLPTQIGSTSLSYPSGSQVVIGRNIDVTFDAAGFGTGGRPDVVQNVILNLTETVDTFQVRLGTVSFNIADFLTILNTNPNTPDQFDMRLRQVLVCDNGVTKNAIILMSQTYPTGSL